MAEIMGLPRKVFSDQEIAAAITLIKTERPDLWERWKQHELNNAGFRDIDADLMALIRKLGITSNLVEMTELKFELRTAVRVELGLWVPDDLKRSAISLQ